MSLPLYIDIDGTLTDAPDAPGGGVIQSRIQKVRSLLDDGKAVVIWSARGTEYAEKFIERNGLTGALAIGKPGIVVDDNPDIRPRHAMKVVSPLEYFGQ